MSGSDFWLLELKEMAEKAMAFKNPDVATPPFCYLPAETLLRLTEEVLDECDHKGTIAKLEEQIEVLKDERTAQDVANGILLDQIDELELALDEYEQATLLEKRD